MSGAIVQKLCQEIVRAQNANGGRKLDVYAVDKDTWIAALDELETLLREQGRPGPFSSDKTKWRNFVLLDTPIIIAEVF